MPNAPVAKAVAAGVTALALVAHLWMFGAPDHHAGLDAVAATAHSTSTTPLELSACPTGMSACRVPAPTEPLRLLLLPLVGSVLVGVALLSDRVTPTGVGTAQQRDPPPRPVVPASVVLLV